MSHSIHDLIARGDARIVEHPAAAPVRHQIEADRNFGLPTTLYGVTIACYLGFLVIVGSAFPLTAPNFPGLHLRVPHIAVRLAGRFSAHPDTASD
ncbi:MAG: hypothetical protein ACK57E_00400, partial [Erythrobacteraceae bacterium]